MILSRADTPAGIFCFVPPHLAQHPRSRFRARQPLSRCLTKKEIRLLHTRANCLAPRYFGEELFHEVRLLKSTPQKIIAQGTDWCFLDESKRGLKR